MCLFLSLFERDYRAVTAFKYTSMASIGVFLSILLPGIAASADKLIVREDNIEEAGEIHIAIYDSAEAFEADRGDKGGAAPGVTQGTIEMVEPSSVTYRYKLPPGTYSIGIFHDANLNNRLDNYFFGIPREQYGFSNTARGFIDQPSFEDAAFLVESETEISVKL